MILLLFLSPFYGSINKDPERERLQAKAFVQHAIPGQQEWYEGWRGRKRKHKVVHYQVDHSLTRQRSQQLSLAGQLSERTHGSTMPGREGKEGNLSDDSFLSSFLWLIPVSS